MFEAGGRFIGYRGIGKDVTEKMNVNTGLPENQ